MCMCRQASLLIIFEVSLGAQTSPRTSTSPLEKAGLFISVHARIRAAGQSRTYNRKLNQAKLGEALRAH